MEVRVATIASAQGLRGEVMINLTTDSPEERIYPGATLRTHPATRGPLEVETVRVHKGRLAVKFRQISDRTQAEAIRGTDLLVDTADIPEEDDAWYRDELIGLKVFDTQGRALGSVSDLTTGDAQDLLHVQFDGREILVPFVYEIVPQVEVAAGRIVVDPPGGLFDDEGQ
ncbi:MAG: ribosome maturation factor RimM [Actinomycetaceae bacterium]|nr:ribosome maturation factor RimM [Actinomycetaceae bacterium]